MAERRGGCALPGVIILVVLIGLLVGGVYVGDGYARGRVEEQVAARLQTELGTPQRPTVAIPDRPFLTQVATRRIRTVHVVADDVGLVTEAALVVQHADLVLTDLVTDDWFRTLTVTRVTGTALVSYDQLRGQVDAPITYAGGDRVKIVANTTVFGVRVEATVTGGLRIDVGRQSITLADPELSVGGVRVPEAAAEAVLRTMVKPIPLTGVPFGLTVTGLRPADDGVHADLEGTNLPISR